MKTEGENMLKEHVTYVNSLSDESLNEAIPELRKTAGTELIPLLIERWSRTENQLLKSALFNLFTESRDASSIGYYMKAIESDNYRDKTAELVSILWQTEFDLRPEFGRLVEIALASDDMTILEVSTVIENMKSIPDPADVSNALDRIDEVLEVENKRNRQLLLKNLEKIIGEFDRE